MWNVYDIKTGVVYANCKTKRAARAKADKLDQAYGAIRHSIREVVSCSIR